MAVVDCRAPQRLMEKFSSSILAPSHPIGNSAPQKAPKVCGGHRAALPCKQVGGGNRKLFPEEIGMERLSQQEPGLWVYGFVVHGAVCALRAHGKELGLCQKVFPSSVPLLSPPVQNWPVSLMLGKVLGGFAWVWLQPSQCLPFGCKEIFY